MREWSVKNWKEYLALSIFILGVIVLRLFYITRTTGPFIYADEMGYWSHAAHMTGNTWAGVMDGVSWYSFGYSFLLALTFLISDNMVVMYRTAVVMNMLMGIGTYIIAYGICKRLLWNYGKTMCGLVAFTVTSFPTYVFYSYTTLSETLLILMVWLLFYELISLEEKPCWWKGILLGVTAGYAFMVHNRMLAVIIAVVLCLIVLWITHKINWKVLAAFGMATVCMLVLYMGMKEYLESMMVQNQVIEESAVSVTRGSYNTFSAMFRKLRRIFVGQNLKFCIWGFAGQLWESLSATYLLLGVGVAYCIKNLVDGFKMKAKVVLFLYPILAFLCLAGLTAVASYGKNLPQTGDKIRIDPAFYGRYNECIFPLLILMAIVFMFHCLQCGKKIYVIVIASFIILSVIMFIRLYGIDNGYINIVSSIGIHMFHWLGEFSVIKCFIVGILVFLITVLLCYFRFPKQCNYYLVCLMLIFLFSTTALYCMKLTIRGENDNTARYSALFDYLNANTQKHDIVYMCDEGKMAFDVQTRLVDKTVICVTTEQLEGLIEDNYALIRENQAGELNITDYSVCLETEGYMIIKAE